MAKKGTIVAGIGLAGGLAYLLTRKAEAHPDNIVLSDLIIYPTEVYVNNPVNISLNATNVGEEEATKEIECEVI